MGTANRRQEQPFTKLEAGEEADKLPPFYIGYYQGCHYQSLEKIQQQHKALGTQRPAGVGVQHGDDDGHVGAGGHVEGDAHDAGQRGGGAEHAETHAHARL